MKLAISGKGGVGKTTLAALLAQVYADQAGMCWRRMGIRRRVWRGRWAFPLCCENLMHPCYNAGRIG